MSSGNTPRPFQIGNNEDFPFAFTFLNSDGTATDCSGWTVPIFAMRNCDDTSGAADLVITAITRTANVFAGAVPEGNVDGLTANTMRNLTPGSYNMEFKVLQSGVDTVAIRGQIDVLGGFS